MRIKERKINDKEDLSIENMEKMRR